MRVRRNKNQVPLPIGRTARIAFEIDAMRAECCRAAVMITDRKPLDEAALEECAQLDEALAAAQRLLKAAVRKVMLGRINRRTKAR